VDSLRIARIFERIRGAHGGVDRIRHRSLPNNMFRRRGDTWKTRLRTVLPVPPVNDLSCRSSLSISFVHDTILS
jgi:hypothetical protein